MKNEKNVQTEVKSEVKKDQKNLDSLLEKINLPEKGITSKDSLYKDSSHLSTFDGGKSFRTKMRKELSKKSFAFLQAVKSKDTTRIKESFEQFNLFYKTNYKKTDFSISSIYGGKENSPQFIYFQQFLSVVAECKKIELI